MPLLTTSSTFSAYVNTFLPRASSFTNFNKDGFLVKYSTRGRPLWSVRIGGFGLENITDVATDSSGNIYVTGKTTQNYPVFIFNADGSAASTLPAFPSDYAYVVKFNNFGFFQWLAAIVSGNTGASAVACTGVAVDGSANVYIVGSYVGVGNLYNGDGTLSTVSLTSVATINFFVAKLNSSGTVQWAARADGGNVSSPIFSKIVVNSAGVIYISGINSSFSPTFYNSNGTSFASTVTGANRGYVISYNTLGTAQWLAQVIGTSSSISGIAIDSSSNIHISGAYTGTSAYIQNANSTNSPFLGSASGSDVIVAKLNSSGITQWLSRIAGSGNDNGDNIAVDSSGNVFLSGTFYASAPVNTIAPGNASSGISAFGDANGDICLIKYNSAGTPQWSARVSSSPSGIDRTGCLAIDTTGNIFLGGYFTGGTSLTAFNATTGSVTIPGAIASSGDLFLAKYNTTGSVLWLTSMGGNSTEDIGNIRLDFNGNIYLAGNYGTARAVTIYGQSSSLFTTLPNSGSFDPYIVKYNASGSPQWITRLASTGLDESYAIASDSSGNLYITGRYAATLSAFNANGTSFATTLTNAGGSDAFVAKYDTNGSVQWLARIASTGADTGYGIAVDSSGNAFIIGAGGSATVTSFSANGTAFSPTLTNVGLGDAFLVKYDTNGTVLWNVRIGSTQADIGYAVACDSSGNIYITGGGGAGSVIAYNTAGGNPLGGISNAGAGDAFVVKYNTNGTPLWIARVASTATDIGYGMAVDSSGNAYVVGYGGTTSAVITAFNTGGTAFSPTLPNAGGSDAFIVKYNTSGTVQWATRIASSSGDIAYAATTDPSGNLIVTGSIGGTTTFYNANATAYQVTFNPSFSAIFIAKYNSNGTVLWVKQLGSSTGAGYSVRTDSFGNIYITGLFFSDATILIDDINQIRIPNGNCIIKFSPNGTFSWVQALQGTVSLPISRGITTDALGNVYLTGSSSSGDPVYVYNLDLTPYSVITNTLSGSADSLIIKYSSSMSPQWVSRVASTGTETANSLALDPSGNVYITGQTGSGSVVRAYNSDNTSFGTSFTSSLQDGYVAKFNTNGSVQWLARLSSTTNDSSNSIATDSSGNVYVTGNYGAATFIAYDTNSSAFATTLTNSGLNDGFIVKYDTSGFVQWVARIASTASDFLYGIATDSSGNVYVIGNGGAAVVTAYNSNGTAFSPTLANAGGSDVCIVKYDTNGTVLWAARIASTGADVGYDIATDSSGNVYVTGAGGSAVVTAFNASGTSFSPTLANAGLGDAFIVKYNTNGIVQWVARVASTLVDIGYAIAVDVSGNVYVGGAGGGATVTAYNAAGTAFASTLRNEGSGDAFLVKYNPSGVVQWVARVASGSQDITYHITTDSGGNVYLCGEGSSNQNSTPFRAFNANDVTAGGLAILSNTTNSSNSFIAKYNSSGNVIWLSTVTSASGAKGVSVDTSGNIYITVNGIGSAMVFGSA